MGNELIFVAFVLSWVTALVWMIEKKRPERLSVILSVSSLVATIALFCFYAWIFLSHQFQFAVVHQYSNMSMPRGLLFASIWTGPSGSLLTWILLLVFAIAVALWDLPYRKKILPYVFFFLGVLLIMFFRSHPFQLNPLIPSDGLGLNPVLSHPLLISHPPLAFIAYSAIVMVYAYALSAIRGGHFAATFKSIRFYGILAFSALTFTIILGSFWAYEVTGWGGYWSFDPIENGSLVAWILLIVLLHFVRLFKKYETFHRPIIITSILLMFSILHMVFLIRSGLISQLSAHAYLEGNLLWILLLTDFAVLVLPLLYFFRFQRQLPPTKPSNKTNPCFYLLAANNLLLLAASLTFVHTHLPFLQSGVFKMLAELLYQNIPYMIFFIAILLLLALLLYYQKTTLRKQNILLSFAISCPLYFFLSSLLAFPRFSFMSAVLFLLIFLGIWCLLAILQQISKQSWKRWGQSMLHGALPFLLLGSFLIALPSIPYWVHLSPHNITKHETLPFDFEMLEARNIPIYLGTQAVHPVILSSNQGTYLAKPSIWKYLRSKQEEELMIPHIETIKGIDYHLVPTGQGLFRIKEGSTRNIGPLTISFKSRTSEELGGNLFSESFLLTLEQGALSENLEMLRISNNKGIQIRSDAVSSSLVKNDIRVAGFQNNVLLISSPSFNDHLEFNFYAKPFAVIFRWSYYLFLIGSLWLFFSLINHRKKRVSADA